jgi:UDP-glucose 4-epimerase
MKRCLVTGATGALGPSVVRVFRDAGYRVRALARRAGGDLPADVEVVEGDIADRAAVDAAVRGAEVVVHLAALLHIVNPPPDLAAEYERVNVEGTRLLTAAAETAGVRRLVLFSTIAVYGDSAGGVLDEASPSAATTFYARTKIAAERIVLASPIGVVLRLAAAYGPRVKGNYRSLVRAIARGRFLPIGRGGNRRTLIFEEDAARAALHVAEADLGGERLFNASDGQLHTVAEIVEAIYRAVGSPPPRLHLPLPLARAALMAAELPFRAVRRRPRIGRLTLDKYTEDVAVSSARLRAAGFEPRWSLHDGWREAVRVLRERGEI